jgi:hypothetical protein
MIFYEIELCQNREEMNNAVYDLRRPRSLPSESEVFTANNNEPGDRSPVANQESVEYASDSSCEGYREFQRQPTERRNSSPIAAASSAFTIDSILGRSEKRDHALRTNGSADKEDEDEGDDRLEGHFVRPTAIPATRPGMQNCMSSLG